MSSSLPETDVLRRLSNEIYRIFDCTQLAILLRVDDNLVDAMQEQTRNPNAIALSVLKEWRNKEGACGRTLYDALNKDPFQHLARKYRAELLQTGFSTVTESSSERSPVMFGSAREPAGAISANALATIAASIPTQKACIDLAAELNFSQVDVLKIDRFDDMMAQRILNAWYAREASHATGRVLYDALSKIGLQVIADSYEHLLLQGGGISPSEEMETQNQIAQETVYGVQAADEPGLPVTVEFGRNVSRPELSTGAEETPAYKELMQMSKLICQRLDLAKVDHALHERDILTQVQLQSVRAEEHRAGKTGANEALLAEVLKSSPEKMEKFYQLMVEELGNLAMSSSDQSASATSSADDWIKLPLSDLRNPLFVDLADTNWPFCHSWKKIVQRLPVVDGVTRPHKVSRRLPYAIPNPQDIMRLNLDGCESDYLQEALDMWVNDKGQLATVGHLWDVLKRVCPGDDADNFFHEFFSQ